MSGKGKAVAGIMKPAIRFLIKHGDDVGGKAAKRAARNAGREAAEKTAKRSLRSRMRDALRNLRERAIPFGKRNKCGDPIDVATGEVLLAQTDVELAGVLPLVLERTHSSSYRFGELFGRSWASTLDQHLELDAGGVDYAASDGMVLRYPLVNIPNVAAPPVEGPQHFALVMTREGGYTLTDQQTGQILHFPAPGEHTGWSRLPLAAITDRNGNRINLEYDEDGALAQVRHSGGYRIAVDTRPYENSDGDAAERRVAALRLLTRDAEGLPQSITLMRYGYDEAGNLSEVINESGLPLRFTYDDEHRLTSWQDRNGQRYEYTYDEHGRAIAGSGTGGFLNTRLQYSDPDASGRRQTLVTDSLGHTTIYTFNEAHQLVAETDPLGNTTHSEWDRYDRLLSRTDPLGNSTRYTYDEAGNTASTTYPDGHRTTAVYNEFGLPTLVTQPDGTAWIMEYDDRGNMTRLTDPSGSATTYTYDDRGAVTGITGPLGVVFVAENDGAGRPTSITDGGGATVQYVHDALGRPAEIVDGSGTTTLRWTVDGWLESRVTADGAEEQWTHDAEGNPVVYADRVGRLEHTEYGPFDLPIATVRPDGTRVAFAYDAELRLIRVTTPEGLSWAYEYDAAGRVLAESDFDGRVIRYTYNAAGNVVSRVNGAGQETTFVRDALGAMLEKHAGDIVTSFRYDDMGRLVRATGAGVDLTLERDQAGRVIAEICNGARLEVARDHAGLTVARTTPTGVRSMWMYDGRGLPSRLETNSGRHAHSLQFTRDALGREVQRQIGNSAILTQQWDLADRLIAQTIWTASGTVGQSEPRLLQHRTYGYRANDVLTTITDRLSGDRTYELDARNRVTTVHAAGWSEQYGYDTIDNITTAAWPTAQVQSGDQSDAAGSRELTGTLLRRTGRVRFDYDAQGRITLREHVSLSGRRRSWRFHWDAEDRLVHVDVPDGTHWYYHYDPLGRRIAKQHVDHGGEIDESYTYAWHGPNLVEQVRRLRPAGQGVPAVHATTWEYEPGSYRPLAQLDRASAQGSQEWVDEQFYSIVGDLVGSPAELVSPDGSITWHRRATLWGTNLDGASATSTPCLLRFPGQYFDAETGFHYNYQRYYDPETGRYASPDPLGMAPQLNPHAYVDNPTSWIDPLGLAPYKLSDPNPMNRRNTRRLSEEYEKIKAHRAAERTGVPSPLGAPTPRVYTHADRTRGQIPPGMNVGDQKVFRGDELGPRNRANWQGAREWDVPGTNHRILELPDGKLGYALEHDYGSPMLFPGPWYPEGGQVPRRLR